MAEMVETNFENELKKKKSSESVLVAHIFNDQRHEHVTGCISFSIERQSCHKSLIPKEFWYLLE